jgi:hypothetical protein
MASLKLGFVYSIGTENYDLINGITLQCFKRIKFEI